MLLNIPAELRERRQWACCIISEPGDPNHKRPINPKTGYWASDIKPETWGTFEEAVAYKEKRQHIAVGFMLHESDPFTIIDLDNKADQPVSNETLGWYTRLAEQANTYVERSISGRGLHIVVKATLPSGRKRQSSEIYSTARFMICTGDVVYDRPITEQQELATWFWEQLESPETKKADGSWIDQPETLDDQTIMQMAWNADNQSKFRSLWFGEWLEMGYPSQSEADFALLSMLAYYSLSDVQVLRLFQQSALGKRDKTAQYKFSLERIRAKQNPIIDIPPLSQLGATLPAPTSSPNYIGQPIINGHFSIPMVWNADMTITLADPDSAPKLPESVTTMGASIKAPGLIGEITEYIYAAAERPVPEIALAAALGLVAGIAGRAYNISRVGLNQYIVLIAKTGTGKEAIGRAIDTLLTHAGGFAPTAQDFHGPAAFASGQAVARYLSEHPCFVSVFGEFGLMLQSLVNARQGDPAHTLKRALLDVYTKSGINSFLKPTAYSDREKNTALVQAPNLTFVGESTPEEFYKALNESAIMDGFVPRLMLVEYTGDRPRLNDNAGFPPPEALVRKLADLVNVATAAGAPNNVKCAQVRQDRDAAQLLRRFNDEIDDRFQGLADGPIRQILNRAHLKALKLAALLAVGCNIYDPVVTGPLAQWAIDFVRREVDMMTTRFESGQVGDGGNAHEHEIAVRVAINKLATMDAKTAVNYKVPAQCVGKGIITHAYLTAYLKNRQPFKGDKRGAGRALAETIKEMLTAGILIEVPKVQAQSQFRLTGAAYTIGEAF